MYFILDLGGTNFRVCWTEALDKVDVTSKTVIIDNTNNYQKDSDHILNIMKSKSSEAKGIVVAIPGSFNHQNMILGYANNLKSWINKPFFKELGHRFNCNLIIDKDSVIAGYGEAFSMTSTDSNFIYLSWGTGVGGCLVSTKTNSLPEITPLNWEETFKEIETLCGGGHAFTNFGVELKDLSRSQWNLLIANFINELVKITDLTKHKFVVLGGGITSKKGVVVSKIQTKLEARGIILIKSKLGDFSAIYGGIALLKTKQK